MYKFGMVSRKKLDSCHEDLQLIIQEALKLSDVDFGISEGHRDVATQQMYFRQGKSKIDGVTKLGKHNVMPSEAVDIYGYVNGRATYNVQTLAYIAGVVTAAAKVLYEQGKVNYIIRWGGNWDRDGEIITDQNFDDLPHFELVKP